MNRTIPSVLTIAGSDSGGGAGIQADLKTIAALGLYGTSAITAITAQNTRGVQALQAVPAGLLAAQLTSVLSDLPPQAIKIGMMATEENVQAIAKALSDFQKETSDSRPVPVVLDPVMVSTSSRPLLTEDAIRAARELLFPTVTLLTPNLPEAQYLLGEEIPDAAAMERAARRLSELCQTSVLLKGGHIPAAAKEDNGAVPDGGSAAADESSSVAPGSRSFAAADGRPAAASIGDVLWERGAAAPVWFVSERLHPAGSHGTGCTLSSAIACGLARGLGLSESVDRGRAYLLAALGFGLKLGRGNSPLFHGCLSYPVPFWENEN